MKTITKPCSVCGKPIERFEADHPSGDDEPWICSSKCWRSLIPEGCLDILERRKEEIKQFINGSHMHVLHGLRLGTPVKCHLVCEAPNGKTYKVKTSFERLSLESAALMELQNLIGFRNEKPSTDPKQ